MNAEPSDEETRVLERVSVVVPQDLLVEAREKLQRQGVTLDTWLHHSLREYVHARPPRVLGLLDEAFLTEIEHRLATQPNTLNPLGDVRLLAEIIRRLRSPV